MAHERRLPRGRRRDGSTPLPARTTSEDELPAVRPAACASIEPHRARHEGAPPCVWSLLELRSSIPVVRALRHHLLPTYSASNTGLMQKKLPTSPGPQEGWLHRGLGGSWLVSMAPIGAKAHSDMITLTLRSQLMSSQLSSGNLCSLSTRCVVRCLTPVTLAATCDF